MRRLIPVLILLFLCGGCSHDEKSKTQESAIFAFPAISEKGVYHLSSKESQSLLYVYDAQSDQDVPLCAKPNCTHRDEQCDAYQLQVYQNEKLMVGPMYYQERLYMIYEDHAVASSTLCSSDETGNNRQEIAKLPKGVITSAMLYHDTLYFSVQVFEYDELGNIKGLSYQYASYALNIQTKECTQIDLDSQSCLYFIGAYDDRVYAANLSFSEKELTKEAMYSVEESTLKLQEAKDMTYVANAFLYGQDSYYYKDGEIRKYSILKKEDSKLKDVEFEEFDSVSATTSPDGLMMFTLANDNTFAGYRFFDIETKAFIETDELVICKFKDGYLTQDAMGVYHFLKK